MQCLLHGIGCAMYIFSTCSIDYCSLGFYKRCYYQTAQRVVISDRLLPVVGVTEVEVDRALVTFEDLS